ncbi:MAG: hypothetical protein Q4F54_01115 [Coriobacteriia bacterium]|nr:hypothetical protein [Coriobacteriia bacterium]
MLVLSTCSTAETEARTVLVAEITDETYEDIFKTNDGYSWPGVEDLEG